MVQKKLLLVEADTIGFGFSWRGTLRRTINIMAWTIIMIGMCSVFGYKVSGYYLPKKIPYGIGRVCV